MRSTNLTKSKIILYTTPKAEIKIDVFFQDETVWLTQKLLAKLFNTTKQNISLHLNNIFKEDELNENSVVKEFLTTALDGKQYQTNYYNLDAIIAVGYRINSKRATQFRIWATNTLKNYILKGYAVNQKRLLGHKETLEKLQETIMFLHNKASAKRLKGQEAEILNLLAEYSKTLTLLELYDKNKLKKSGKRKKGIKLDYETCVNIITKLKKHLIAKKQASPIFGIERSKMLESIIKNLYQTFASQELYKSFEQKAAHLLYLIIKDHPFTDGNKRIGAFLFIYFLDKNNFLHRKNGERKINDNALTALALLIAESRPKEKGQMIALITQLII